MIKHFALLAAIGAMAFAETAAADQDDNPDWSKQQQQAAGSSGLGETCRRRTDCKEGLKCVRRTCTDPHEGETCGATADCGGGELKCIADKCTNPNAVAASSTSKPGNPQGGGGGGGGDEGDTAKPGPAQPAPSGDWMKFRLDDGQTHPFIGITGLLGGFGLAGQDVGGGLGFGSVLGTSLFALKAGIIVGGHHELAAEVTPFFTAFPNGAAVFETNVSYAYLIPITDHVSWPLRLGVGIMAGTSPNAQDNAWFEVRADLIGVQISVGHLLIDLHLPSFRYFVTSANDQTFHTLNWDFGAGFGYAF